MSCSIFDKKASVLGYFLLGATDVIFSHHGDIEFGLYDYCSLDKSELFERILCLNVSKSLKTSNPLTLDGVGTKDDLLL